MAIISPTPPTIGQPNSTEDPDVLAYLTALKNLVNGGLDNANIAALAAIAGSKIADASITAAKMATGAVAVVKISEVTLTSAGTITFSSIPQTYKSLRVIGNVRSTRPAVASSASFTAIFNGSAAALYQYTQILAQGASVTGTSASGATSLFLGEVSAATASGSAFSGVDIAIQSYSSTTMWKTLVARTQGQMTGGMRLSDTAGEWQSAAAISSITFSDSVTSQLETGSTLALYGIV